jgi:hypothetical protein
VSERKCGHCGGTNLEIRYVAAEEKFADVCDDCWTCKPIPVHPASPAKTLRDEFAMAALSGLLAGRSEAGCDPYGHAIEAYQCADAMMTEREKADD